MDVYKPQKNYLVQSGEENYRVVRLRKKIVTRKIKVKKTKILVKFTELAAILRE